MAAGNRRSPIRKYVFHGYFGLLLEFTIVVAAVLWVVYGYLPRQYYLPISFLAIVAVGFASYFIFNKKIAI